jgi:hypothetical protein
MASSLHTVVETPEFLAGSRQVLADAERTELIDFLAANPTAGDLMQGTGGARKLRWGAGSRGKRGGARVITFYGGASAPVFLLAVFGKNEKANLTKAERNELRALLGGILEVYRAGVAVHVQRRTEHP